MVRQKPRMPGGPRKGGSSKPKLSSAYDPGPEPVASKLVSLHGIYAPGVTPAQRTRLAKDYLDRAIETIRSPAELPMMEKLFGQNPVFQILIAISRARFVFSPAEQAKAQAEIVKIISTSPDWDSATFNLAHFMQEHLWVKAQQKAKRKSPKRPK